MDSHSPYIGNKLGAAKKVDPSDEEKDGSDRLNRRRNRELRGWIAFDSAGNGWKLHEEGYSCTETRGRVCRYVPGALSISPSHSDFIERHQR